MCGCRAVCVVLDALSHSLFLVRHARVMLFDHRVRALHDLSTSSSLITYCSTVSRGYSLGDLPVVISLAILMFTTGVHSPSY